MASSGLCTPQQVCAALQNLTGCLAPVQHDVPVRLWRSILQALKLLTQNIGSADTCCVSQDACTLCRSRLRRQDHHGARLLRVQPSPHCAAVCAGQLAACLHLQQSVRQHASASSIACSLADIYLPWPANFVLVVFALWQQLQQPAQQKVSASRLAGHPAATTRASHVRRSAPSWPTPKPMLWSCPAMSPAQPLVRALPTWSDTLTVRHMQKLAHQPLRLETAGLPWFMPCMKPAARLG